jgi:SAM-dependent methyltransferase
VTAVDLRSYPFSHPDLRSIQGDLLAQSLPAESFDAAVAVSVIEHCGLSGYGEAPREEGDRQVVARIHGLLRPGGRFLLSVPYGRAGESRKGWRVYDAEGLAALLGDFRVEAAQYFLGLGREHWTPVAPEALAEVESARRGFVQGVACVCAVR